MINCPIIFATLIVAMAWPAQGMRTLQFAQPTSPPQLNYLTLERREVCPATFPIACGAGCCASGWVCGTDSRGNSACCPSGAVCTGIIALPTGTPNGNGDHGGSGGSGNTAGVVPNTFYPFPYIPTSFSNGQACSQAYQTCTANYQMCTNQLQGSAGYGVTITAPGGGGTTVAGGAVSLAPTSAQALCSSLSSVACLGLSPSICQQSGTLGPFVVSGTSRRHDIVLVTIFSAFFLGIAAVLL